MEAVHDFSGVFHTMYAYVYNYYSDIVDLHLRCLIPVHFLIPLSLTIFPVQLAKLTTSEIVFVGSTHVQEITFISFY